VSIAAITESIDNFATNDASLRDMLIGYLDTELAEIEAERSKMNAAFDARRQRIADRKVTINAEFEQRAADIYAILNGRG
jgi:septal ring factor EnvC (AmiA/AmiB activator)